MKKRSFCIWPPMSLCKNQNFFHQYTIIYCRNSQSSCVCNDNFFSLLISVYKESWQWQIDAFSSRNSNVLNIHLCLQVLSSCCLWKVRRSKISSDLMRRNIYDVMGAWFTPLCCLACQLSFLDSSSFCFPSLCLPSPVVSWRHGYCLIPRPPGTELSLTAVISCVMRVCFVLLKSPRSALQTPQVTEGTGRAGMAVTFVICSIFFCQRVTSPGLKIETPGR